MKPEPLLNTRRADLVARMAARLIECGTYSSESDAMRSLVGNYAIADIMMLIDDARQVATQEAVARDMTAR